jgi:hypothetical protein
MTMYEKLLYFQSVSIRVNASFVMAIHRESAESPVPYPSHVPRCLVTCPIRTYISVSVNNCDDFS